MLMGLIIILLCRMIARFPNVSKHSIQEEDFRAILPLELETYGIVDILFTNYLQLERPCPTTSNFQKVSERRGLIW